MNVTVYSTPTCPYCKMAKEFLTTKGVTFVETDVSADEAAQATMTEKSGQTGVPVILVVKDDGAEEVIVGFDQAKLDEATN